MINKSVIKEVSVCKCPRLSYLLVNDQALVKFTKYLIEHDFQLSDINGVDFDFEKIADLVSENKQLVEELKDILLENASEVKKLIFEMKDYEEVSKLSRKYYFDLYKGKAKRADTINGELDGTLILSNKLIEENTIKLLNDPEVDVIFEGQLTFKDKYLARWDILIKNESELELIELKASSYKDKKIKEEYLLDLIFQYFVYKNVLPKLGFTINKVNFLFLNNEFYLNNEKVTYPLLDKYLPSLFSTLVNTYKNQDLITYIDSRLNELESLLNFIEESADNEKSLDSKMQYCCKKCLFFNECLTRCNYPSENSIFSLNNSTSYGGFYKKSKQLIEECNYKTLDEIDDDLQKKLYPLNYKKDKYSYPHLQIEVSKKRINNWVDLSKIKKLLKKDYQIYPLVFFDFETFMYPLPIINRQKPYEPVCTQYSMHVVNKDYDLFSHDFDKGSGGNITHYEFIGFPRIDLSSNPEINLIETLIKQFEQEKINYQKGEFTIVVYNKQFEQGRFENLIKKYPVYENFLSICKKRIVDLLEFFQFGYIYLPSFNGKASLKVVSPSLMENSSIKEYYANINFDLTRTLDYQSEDNVIHNGSEALDAYQSLIRACLTDNVSDKLHDDIIKGLLYYCKKDSWGTVVIFDIISKIANGQIVLK